jgi:hypothetical protein
MSKLGATPSLWDRRGVRMDSESRAKTQETVGSYSWPAGKVFWCHAIRLRLNETAIQFYKKMDATFLDDWITNRVLEGQSAANRGGILGSLM